METVPRRGPQLGWRQEKKLDVRIRQDSGCYDSDSQHGSPDIMVGQLEDITFKWVEQTQSVFDQEKDRMRQLSDKCKLLLENSHDADERELIMDAWKKGIKEIAVLTRDLIDCIAQDVIELVDDAGKSPSLKSPNTSSWELEQIEEEEAPDEEFHFYMLSPKTMNFRRRRRSSYEDQLKKILSGVKKHRTGHVLIPKTKCLPRGIKKNLKKLSKEHQMEWNAVSIKIKSGWDSDEEKKPEEETEEVEDIYEEWREWNLKDFFGPKWKEEDLEPEDILNDWLQSFKDNSTKGDMNDIFWDIELDEEVSCGHRRLNEELKGLPISDQPDVIHDCCELLEGKFATQTVLPQRKRPKDYVNIFKSWRHNLNEYRPKRQKEHVGKMRPPKKTRHITRIFDKEKTWYHYPKKYPKVRYNQDEPETIFGEWNWNLENVEDDLIVKSYSFEWIPGKPSILKFEEFYEQWKWNLNGHESKEDLPEDILNDYRHNYVGPIVPGEILFQDWPFLYDDENDDEGFEDVEDDEQEVSGRGRRKSHDEDFDLEETNLRPYFSPKRQRLDTLQPEDYFEDWRHEIDHGVLDPSAIQRQFEDVFQSGQTVAQILDKQFDEVKAFDLWPFDTAKELLHSRREFNWLRNIIKNKRSRQKEINETVAPEKWFCEWRWQLELTSEEPEDIFADWRDNLQEEEEVEDIFQDWLHMLDSPHRRHSLRHRDSAPLVLHQSGHRLHKKLISEFPTLKLTALQAIPKHVKHSVPKYARSHQKRMTKCYPKQPQLRGLS